MTNILKGKYFDFPKPIFLLKTLLEQSSGGEDIILDFFAGSGTTAQAVLDLNKEDGGNRKYICVQLPELCDEKSEAFKAGFQTIADISKERIRRAGIKIREEIESEIEGINKKIADLGIKIADLEGQLPTDDNKSEIENQRSEINVLELKIQKLQSQDLGFKVLKLQESNFKQWRQLDHKDANALTDQIKLFVDPVAVHASTENMVYELLLKSGKDLNSKIEKEEVIYWINGQELVLLLEEANETIIEKVIKTKPKKVIALDRLFEGNDQLKTNTVLQMKDAGVEFKPI